MTYTNHYISLNPYRGTIVILFDILGIIVNLTLQFL